MSEYLYHYHPVEPSTWMYLSSLLMIGLFFKFGRFWSVRNLDLMLLIAIGPGLLFVHYGHQLAGESAQVVAEANQSQADLDEPTAVDKTGEETELTSDPSMLSLDDVKERLTEGLDAEWFGFFWLFCVGVLILARLLADPTMVRRPLLEPNLSAGGLIFIGCSLFVFLTANVMSKDTANSTPTDQSDQPDATPPVVEQEVVRSEGPGYAYVERLPSSARKIVAILSHLAVVVGMVSIGYRHFGNIVMGVGAATLYLMLPYTSLMTHLVSHALPAALLVWAILWYRQPLVAGMFLGLASGLTYYALFLLPLWFSFYWPRGLMRFVAGLGIMLATLVGLLLVFSDEPLNDVIRMFGLMRPAMKGLDGLWDIGPNGGWSPFYRIPVLASFVALSISMALWPAQKNLGTLLSCSAAIMVASQFWHGHGGGIYVAWYLPLLLLTIFRPNLEDRVAISVLSERWLPRKLSLGLLGKAA